MEAGVPLMSRDSGEPFAGLAVGLPKSWRVRATIALLIALSVWGLTDVRRRARIDPLNSNAHKSDLTVYTEAGEAFFDGRDPYEVTNPRGWHYLYPPLFAIAVSPLSLLPSQAQAVAWFAISVLACWGSLLECRAVLRWVTQQERQRCIENGLQELPTWLGWGAMGVMLIPVLNCLQRGQVGTVVLYFLLLGFRKTLVSTNFRAAMIGGCILALPVAIKLTPALPVGVWLLQLIVIAWRHGWKAQPAQRAAGAWAGATAGAVVFLILLPSAAVGPIDNLHHLHTWVDRVVITDDVGADNDFNERSKRNQSLTNAVHRFGNWAAHQFAGAQDDRMVEDNESLDALMPMNHPAVDLGVRLVQVGLLALLLVAGWRVSRLPDVPASCTVFALASALTLLISPLSWVHHYVIWLPALLLVPYLQITRGAPRLAAAMLSSAAGLVWLHYLAMDWTGRVGLLGLGTTVWFVAATTWVSRQSDASPSIMPREHSSSAHLEASQAA